MEVAMLIQYKRLFPDARLPERATSGAVGFDVYAYHVVDKVTREHVGNLPAVIEPGGSLIIGTGIAFAVPFPVDCQVRPRSGLASKHDVELSNSPGTLDPDYRGEAGILLRNRGMKSFTVEPGMRIAQLVFTKIEVPEFMEVEELPGTTRGDGGFGSTGLNEGIAAGTREYHAEQLKWDQYFMGIAKSAAGLSDCLRGAEKGPDGRYLRDAEGRYCGVTRRFGCVIVKDRNVIATGFNTRTADCNEQCGCIRETQHIPSGTANDRGCLHAEQVAIQNFARSGGPSLVGATVFVNAEPCVMCSKLLLGCGIATVVVPEGVYATNGLPLLTGAGIEVRNVKI